MCDEVYSYPGFWANLEPGFKAHIHVQYEGTGMMHNLSNLSGY